MIRKWKQNAFLIFGWDLSKSFWTQRFLEMSILAHNRASLQSTIRRKGENLRMSFDNGLLVPGYRKHKPIRNDVVRSKNRKWKDDFMLIFILTISSMSLYNRTRYIRFLFLQVVILCKKKSILVLSYFFSKC